MRLGSILTISEVSPRRRCEATASRIALVVFLGFNVFSLPFSSFSRFRRQHRSIDGFGLDGVLNRDQIVGSRGLQFGISWIIAIPSHAKAEHASHFCPSQFKF